MITILLFLFVLSVLVIAHEWGHYFAAKKMGMKVEEFGIGFPPRVFGWKNKDGMLWSLNVIPLGGFVKIAGENGEKRDSEGSFASKSIPARLLVLAAGVMMNLVLAAVIFTISLMIGIPSVIEGDQPAFADIRSSEVRVLEVLDGSAADEAGFEVGDVIAAVDGEAPEGGEALRARMDESPQLTFSVQRGNESLDIPVSANYVEEFDDEIYGVLILETGLVRYPFYLAPFKAIELTALYTGQIVIAFAELIASPFTSADVQADFAGPVGIAEMTGDIAAQGFTYLLQFMALLSLNLAVLNILPFPALDGGRILFVLIEAVRQKPNSAKVEAIVHNIGFLVLISLVIIVTYSDIASLVTGS
ncbi:MAG: M50 family metallopeptidase [bacterium]|nr:M50 family metallopeptidase [bacterium]MDA1024685.1 M50 family metallopeptidase [bacterium]